MLSTKKLLFLLLVIFLAMPVKVCIPQQAENEMSQTDETDTSISKKEKKKKVLEIDEEFFINLGINVVAVFLIIVLIYYPNYRKLDYIFTFVIFNLVIFLLTFVMKYVKLSMGAAFGLFAVFSMLRYRTEGISIKDMTYLFIFIAMGLISAVQLEYYELITILGVLLVGTFILDGKYIIKREFYKSVQYENIELIKPENYDKLIEDMRNRLGLNVHRVTVNKIDFLRDTAIVKVYYYE
jgi:hypothetical protein